MRSKKLNLQHRSLKTVSLSSKSKMIWKNKFSLPYLSTLLSSNYENHWNGDTNYPLKKSNISNCYKSTKKSKKSKVSWKIVQSKSQIYNILDQFIKDKWYVRISVYLSCCLNSYTIWEKILKESIKRLRLLKMRMEKKVRRNLLLILTFLISHKKQILFKSSMNFTTPSTMSAVNSFVTIFCSKFTFQNGSTSLLLTWSDRMRILIWNFFVRSSKITSF